MKQMRPNEKHKALMDDLVETIRRHAGDDMPPEVMLAVSANLCGRLIAALDQRKFTKEKAFDILFSNVETGNAEMVAMIHTTGGTA